MGQKILSSFRMPASRMFSQRWKIRISHRRKRKKSLSKKFVGYRGTKKKLSYLKKQIREYQK